MGSLYTDYKKDLNGPYTVVLGYRVSLIAEIPEGAVAKIVTFSMYVVLHIKGLT